MVLQSTQMSVFVDEVTVPSERAIIARVRLLRADVKKAQCKVFVDPTPKRLAKLARLRSELTDALEQLRAF